VTLGLLKEPSNRLVALVIGEKKTEEIVGWSV
jgi:hypothetical protein